MRFEFKTYDVINSKKDVMNANNVMNWKQMTSSDHQNEVLINILKRSRDLKIWTILYDRELCTSRSKKCYNTSLRKLNKRKGKEGETCFVIKTHRTSTWPRFSNMKNSFVGRQENVLYAWRGEWAELTTKSGMKLLASNSWEKKGKETKGGEEEAILCFTLAQQ